MHPTRYLRWMTVVATCAIALTSFEQLALAEEGESRILVLPLRGPRGVLARDSITERIEGEARVKSLGGEAAKQLARAARVHKASAVITGGIRCPGRTCKVEVVIYRRSGRVWSKAAKTTPRASVAEIAADLAQNQLEDLGLLSGGGAGETDEPSGAEMDFSMESDPEVEDEPSDADSGEEEEQEQEEEEEENPEDAFDFDAYEGEESKSGGRSRRRRRRNAPAKRYKAIEVYLNSDITVLRNLCADMAPELENDQTCDINDPGDDDRTYNASPFANLGLRLVTFPGAFFNRRAWWIHAGLYFDYGHSLVLSTNRDYLREEIPTEENPNPPDEQFSQTIDTTQQDFRLGLMWRFALSGPQSPQFRVMAGFGYYEFYLDDSDYPPRVNEAENWRLTVRHQRTTPYLPAFTYSTIDLGLEFRFFALDGMLIPYTSLLYRGGLSAGAADDLLGNDSSSHGVDWELGVHVELAYGIRLAASMQLIWYGVFFSGEEAALPPGHMWGDTPPGEQTSDTILRFRIAAGWSF